jgi:hypothetical protein
VADVTLTGTLFAPGAQVHVEGPGVDARYDATFIDSQTIKLIAVNLSNAPVGAYTMTAINPGPHASGSISFSVTP